MSPLHPPGNLRGAPPAGPRLPPLHPTTTILMSTIQPDLAAAPAQEGDDARVAATIQNWKRKLLDVSKRNRALNFKPNKVTTLAIVDEQPAEAFRQLYIREKAMKFQPAPPKPEATAGSDASAGSGVAPAPRPADRSAKTSSSTTTSSWPPRSGRSAPSSTCSRTR